MDEQKGETAPALGISLEMQYAGGRKVVMQTHVAQDVSKDTLDGILDKLNSVADRQEAFYAQEQAKAQLEVEQRAYENIVRRLQEVDAKYQERAAGDGKRVARISEAEVRERKQAMDNVEESKKRVAICQKHLDELVRKAGNRDGANSGPNN